MLAHLSTTTDERCVARLMKVSDGSLTSELIDMAVR